MNSSKIKKYVGLIESSNVYDVAQITPVTKANQLSKLLKNEVLLKREDLQPIFSFKIRGAYNKLSKLKQKGIKITSSCNALSTLTASLILPLRVLTFTKSPGSTPTLLS